MKIAGNSLSRNYPNPFNPSTVLEYTIPQNNFVTLRVYDVMGREVGTLVQGYKATGKYSVTFDGSKLSSGVYFYTLKSGNFMGTKKMILVK